VESAIILSIMTMVGKALQHKMGDYEDDKGDITPESMVSQLLKDTGSSFASLLVGGSELYELILGVAEGKAPYDIEAAGISTINDLYQNTYSLFTAANVIGDKDMSADEKMKKLEPRLWKFASSLSEMFGIPLNNARNLVDGIAANAKDMIAGKPLSFENAGVLGAARGRQTSNSAVAGYIAQAMMDGNQAEAERLYNEQLRQGKTADSLNSAIATWQKQNIPEIRQAAEAIEAGNISEYNRLLNGLTKQGISLTNAVKYVESERKKLGAGEEKAPEAVQPGRLTYDQITAGMTKEESDQVYTNGMINSLLEDGNVSAAKAIRDDMLARGKKQSAISSSLSSYWKERYIEAYNAGDMTEVRRITDMLVELGVNRSTITGWTGTKSSGSSYSSSYYSSGFGKSSSKKKGFGKSTSKKSKFGGGKFGK
jgi:pentatricopeptide repeat protein